MPGRQLPAWLPLYLVLVLGVTLSPPWIHCAPQRLHILFAPLDLVQNALLFVPLGLGLRRQPVVAVLVLSALFSGGIEATQRWLLRDPNGADLLANLAGAALGRALPLPAAPRLSLAALRRGLPAAAVVLLAVALASTAFQRPGDFSNWERFPLVLGNEARGPRPWTGWIAALAIYDRAVPLEEANALGSDPDDRAWSEGGPVLSLDFQGTAGGRLDGPAGRRPVSLAVTAGRIERAGWLSNGEPWFLPVELADHVRERLVARGRLSVRTRQNATDLDLRGPARIVTLSADPSRRDFTLAQSGRDLQLRVRTPGNGRNGDRVSAWTHSGAVGPGFHDVWAVYDGARASVRVDGRCLGDGLVALTELPPPLSEMLTLVLLTTTTLAGLALAVWVRPARRQIGLWAGGGGAWLAMQAAGCWDHLPGFDAPSLAIAAISLAAAMPLLRALPTAMERR